MCLEGICFYGILVKKILTNFSKDSQNYNY